MMRKGGRAGYTLLELLIVVAVIAMVAGLGVPFFARSLDRAELRSAAGEVAALMRLARQEAIARKTVFSAVVDPGRNIAYAIEGRHDARSPAAPFNGKMVVIPDAVKIWTPGSEPFSLEFTPVGTATGCDLAVTSRNAAGPGDGTGYRVTVDPLSGRARVMRDGAAGG